MKRAIVSIVVIVLFSAFPCQVIGQVSSTAASIGADAKVIAPISITNTGSTPLNFGTVSRSATAGTIIVTPAGLRSNTGGATILSSSLFSAAPFSVTGENSAAYNITLPDNDDVVLTRIDGTETMEVTAFAHNSTLVLSGSGAATFSVGATLNLDADQVAGSYHGTFSVTVAYQ